MKKTLALVLALVLSLSVVSAFAAETISIMATYNPHAEVLELVKENYDAKGYNLDIIPVSDYVVENPATSAGDIQANFFPNFPQSSFLLCFSRFLMALRKTTVPSMVLNQHK